MPSILLYVGLLACLLGLIGLFPSRRRWLRLFLLGIPLILLAFFLPVPDYHAGPERSRFNDFFPVYQFGERHTLWMRSDCPRAYLALKAVTAEEITLFRMLTWLRRLGRKGPESILNAPDTVPLLEVATRSGFLWLADEPGREGVLGTVLIAPEGAKYPADSLEFKRLTAPGYAVAAINFRFLPETSRAGTGCRVVTETRIRATDANSRRAFSRYWRVIYPGSAIIRVMWLRAIRQRAEST